MSGEYYIIFQAHPRTVKNCKSVQEQCRLYQREMEKENAEFEFLSALNGETDGYIYFIIRTTTLPKSIPSTCHFFRKNASPEHFISDVSIESKPGFDSCTYYIRATHIPTTMKVSMQGKPELTIKQEARDFIFSALLSTTLKYKP